MIAWKLREELRVKILTAKLIHGKECLIECVCGKDEVMFAVDEYTELVTAERVRFAEMQAERYGKILQRMGTNKCVTCEEYIAEADEVYCDGCENIVHQGCAGLALQASYYGDDGTVLCVDCKKKEDERQENEPIQMDPWGDSESLFDDNLPF